MRDATGAVQSVLVLGANSDIASAFLAALADHRLSRAVLAVREPSAAADQVLALGELGVDARAVAYDATNVADHDRVLADAGDVDVVVVAFGVLGDPYDLSLSTEAVAELGAVNYVGGVAAAHASARHLVGQGHGSLVVLSSVAGARVRADNAVYGSTKAGLDGFVQGLSDAVHGTGVHVMIVRPGFVASKMTVGMEPAPFATTPDEVAADMVSGLAKGKAVVWSPAVLQAVFAGLKPLPAPLWRRLGR